MDKEEKRKKEIAKRLTKRKQLFLEHNYKYLTLDIAEKYAEMAKGLEKCSKKWNELKSLLENIYGTTEIEAINILNNREDLISLYVGIYEQIKNFEIKDNEEDFEDDEEPITIDLDEDINMAIDEYMFEEDD